MSFRGTPFLLICETLNCFITTFSNKVMEQLNPFGKERKTMGNGKAGDGRVHSHLHAHLKVVNMTFHMAGRYNNGIQMLHLVSHTGSSNYPHYILQEFQNN